VTPHVQRETERAAPLAVQGWPTPGRLKRSGPPLNIGLVNNMPDAALAATERQFRRLIETAAGGRAVQLKLFSLPDIPRSDGARDYMRGVYASTHSLPASGVDALIVTGAEPLAKDLRDEPYWPSLAALADWAQVNTVSTLWSCLAAHAAVLHLDGVERRSLSAKCSGVFPVTKSARHPLLAGQRSKLLVPHSRLNALGEAELTAKGYTVLTRSDAIGVDAFVRQSGSLFLFLQGHPEYDADSLALEYRRDVRRFLRGERDTHPTVPTGYFEPETERALVALAQAAARQPTASVLSQTAKLIAGAPPVHRWSSATGRLYRNWLDLIEAKVKATTSASM
jgi:homoserine O-succinyltransferase